METKRVVTLIAFVLFMAAGFFLYFLIYTKQPPIQGLAINNGRDEHGCIEGYSWNETALSCINTKNEYQITNFQSCSDAGYAINEDNKTGSLQCYALNGTIFIENSNITQANNSNITTYPEGLALQGNLTIKSTNETNSSLNTTNIS
jgi:hypothetical protein